MGYDDNREARPSLNLIFALHRTFSVTNNSVGSRTAAVVNVGSPIVAHVSHSGPASREDRAGQKPLPYVIFVSFYEQKRNLCCLFVRDVRNISALYCFENHATLYCNRTTIELAGHSLLANHA